MILKNSTYISLLLLFIAQASAQVDSIVQKGANTKIYSNGEVSELVYIEQGLIEKENSIGENLSNSDVLKSTNEIVLNTSDSLKFVDEVILDTSDSLKPVNEVVLNTSDSVKYVKDTIVIPSPLTDAKDETITTVVSSSPDSINNILKLVPPQPIPDFNSVSDTNKINYKRLSVVVGGVSLFYLGAYYFVFKKGWWEDSGSNFTFENDFKYAKNMDKAGHFFSGVLMGETFYNLLRWSNVKERPAYLIAGGCAFLSHLAIDIKDGYSPGWGFSKWDVIAGTVGGFWPFFKSTKAGSFVDFKYSYWVNTTTYYNKEGHTFGGGVPTDDYENQTVWLSLKVNNILSNMGNAEKYWPDFLGLAVGLSVDDKIVYNMSQDDAKYELYVALDFDWEGAIKPKTILGQKLISYVNYIKLPAPTLQVFPKVKMHWAYPIIF